MTLRIDPVQSGPGHCHGDAIGLQCALVSCGVHAQCETAGDAEATGCKMVGELARVAQPCGCGIAAADHGQLRHIHQIRIASTEQGGRRIAQVAQPGRVGAVTVEQQLVAWLGQPGLRVLHGGWGGCVPVIPGLCGDAQAVQDVVGRSEYGRCVTEVLAQFAQRRRADARRGQ